jgi:8-hydroxy-5-deazaflavin:NADPH oxidoreductase
MKIAIIGYGNVGRTLGLRWSERGHEVVFAVRDPDKAEVRGFREAYPGVVVRPLEEAVGSAVAVCLAVPYAAALSLGAIAEAFAEKIVVDCTNPIGPGLALSVGFSTSGAEEIARVLPGARVVKAFSTTGWENMADAV